MVHGLVCALGPATIPPTATPPPLHPHLPPMQITALGLPKLLERVSSALLAIRSLFIHFDADGNGWVTREEFARVYDQLFADASKERAVEMFDRLAGHHDAGAVDYLGWIQQVHGVCVCV
jgi:hypothetical protein